MGMGVLFVLVDGEDPFLVRKGSGPHLPDGFSQGLHFRTCRHGKDHMHRVPASAAAVKVSGPVGDQRPDLYPVRDLFAGFGLKREAASMAAGLKEMDALVHRWDGVRVREKNFVFNLELVRALELRAMLDVGRACAHASLPRQESRGSHFRYDPQVYNEVNAMKISKELV